jgi:hypothetical protein
MFSFRPIDIVRNIELIRNIFYPPVYERKGIGKDTAGEKLDHSAFKLVLEDFVSDQGFVDYISLSKKPENLDLYINELTKADTGSLSNYEYLALMLNAYNAFTLKLIIENPGIESIKDISSAKRWDDKRWIIGDNTLSLNEIEHDIIRQRYGEPLVHFALVCASKSCPKLRNEPFTGSKLLFQLNDQATHFFSQQQNFRWDEQNNKIYLSEILDWFRYDFAENEEGVVEYAINYIDPETAKDIKKKKQDLKIKYISYDWSLNGKWN